MMGVRRATVAVCAYPARGLFAKRANRATGFNRCGALPPDALDVEPTDNDKRARDTDDLLEQMILCSRHRHSYASQSGPPRIPYCFCLYGMRCIWRISNR